MINKYRFYLMWIMAIITLIIVGTCGVSRTGFENFYNDRTVDDYVIIRKHINDKSDINLYNEERLKRGEVVSVKDLGKDEWEKGMKEKTDRLVEERKIKEKMKWRTDVTTHKIGPDTLSK